jgi:hypothetical protein
MYWLGLNPVLEFHYIAAAGKIFEINERLLYKVFLKVCAFPGMARIISFHTGLFRKKMLLISLQLHQLTSA